MKDDQLVRVAILMTCYNRVESTLLCLNSLYSANLPINTKFDIYLVDDKSPDQTGKIVKDKYPYVNVIFGNGSLYWNRGMRLAWKQARKQRDYDFYIWVNDDAQVNSNAFEVVFNDYHNLLSKGIEAIISGVCYDINTNEITYGGRDIDFNLIIPNGLPQPCRYISGNFTLISRKIFRELGFLSFKYMHAAGDNDYGIRAIRCGFQCFISSYKIALCFQNKVGAEQDWKNASIPFIKRIKDLFSIKGANIIDCLFFIHEDKGTLIMLKTMIYHAFNVLFPAFHIKSLKRKIALKCNFIWFGNDYGGFYICPDLLKKNNDEKIIYSFGVGEDISFDIDIMKAFPDCKIYAFDPTPKSIEYVKKQNLPENMMFFPFGVSSKTGVEKMFLPKNKDHVSGSIIESSHLSNDNIINVKMKSMEDIIKENDHDYIDIIKMDIEGAEFSVIDKLNFEKINCGQMLIETHERFFRNEKKLKKNMIRKLKKNGYYCFAVSNNGFEYSFMNIRKWNKK
jgi:FkbM family methyltransferase